jgi:putative inorganic carbon (HCO3(-)) transporter
MRETALSIAPDYSAVLPNLDSIIRGLLYVFVFSLPFNRLLFLQRNGFIILVVLAVVWCVVNRGHFFTRTPIDGPLLAFFIWDGVTIPFATFPEYSAKEFAKLLQQGLLFYMVVYFFMKHPYAKRLMMVILGTVGIVSVYGLYEFLGMVGLLSSVSSPGMLESVTAGEVWLTTYLVMSVPLGYAMALGASEKRIKVLFAGIAGLATLCLTLTFSRAGLVALFCELWAFVGLSRRRALLVWGAAISLLLVAAAGTIYLYNINSLPVTESGKKIAIRGLSSSSMLHRMEIWTFTVVRIAEHPLMGIGYGKDNFKQVFGGNGEKIQPGGYGVLEAGTHNIFLDLALGIGLPGLALFVWLLYRIIGSILTGYHRATDSWQRVVLLGIGVSLIGLTVRLCFDQMLIGSLAIQFWILVAIGVAVSKHVPLRVGAQHA